MTSMKLFMPTWRAFVQGIMVACFEQFTNKNESIEAYLYLPTSVYCNIVYMNNDNIRKV